MTKMAIRPPPPLLLGSDHDDRALSPLLSDSSSSSSLDETSPYRSFHVIQINDQGPCAMELSNDFPPCQFPRQYSRCPDIDDASMASHQQATILFDYELHFASRHVPVDVVEGLLLQQVAESFGLIAGCEDQPSRFLQPRQEEEDPSSAILSISDPSDQVLPDASCSSLVESSVAVRSECRPVRGNLTLTFENDASRLAVVSHTLRQIRSTMIENTLTEGSIEKVVFMGQVQLGGDPIPSNGSIRGGSNSVEKDRLSSGSKAVLILLLFAALGLLVWLRSRRKRRAEQVGQIPAEEDDNGEELIYFQAYGEEESQEQRTIAIDPYERTQITEALAETSYLDDPMFNFHTPDVTSGNIIVPWEEDEDEYDSDMPAPYLIPLKGEPPSPPVTPRGPSPSPSVERLGSMSEPTPILVWPYEDEGGEDTDKGYETEVDS